MVAVVYDPNHPKIRENYKMSLRKLGGGDLSHGQLVMILT